MKTRALAASFLVVLAVAGTTLAENWPRFRGVGGNPVSSATGVPATWSATENIVWKAPMPGYGASSPIVWGDRIFVTAYSGYGTSTPGERDQLKQHVLCIDSKNGKILWDQATAAAASEQNYRGFVALHGFASATPVTDGEAVYASFGSSGVRAYSVDGKPLWQGDIGNRTAGFGTAASPILFEDLVIVNASVESGSLVALDKKSGDEKWRASGIRRSWNTPVLVENPAGKTELVLTMEGQVVAHDPATGKQLWTCESTKDYICPSAIAHEGIVYAIAGRRSPCVAIKTGGSGDVTATHRLWTAKTPSNVPSPLYHDGHLYWVSDSGVAFVLDAKTGDVVTRRRVGSTGRVYASGVLADGKIYVVTREKGTFVFNANPEFEEIAHNTIEGDDSIFNGTPAVVDGRLILRSDRALYCIGK